LIKVNELKLDHQAEISFIENIMKKIYEAEKANVGTQKVLDSVDKSNKSKEQKLYVSLLDNMIT
jgi:hypothetical protein